VIHKDGGFSAFAFFTPQKNQKNSLPAIKNRAIERF
jgi:hypothetical protein